MISTQDLSRLPGIDDFRTLWQSLAMLDAILSPDWDYRYYAFNQHWGADQALGSMRDGEGDHLFALFTPDGCILKGYAREAQMAPDSLDRAAVWPFGEDDPVLAALGHEPGQVGMRERVAERDLAVEVLLVLVVAGPEGDNDVGGVPLRPDPALGVGLSAVELGEHLVGGVAAP